MEAFLQEWGTEIILSLIITMLGYFLKRSADDRRKQNEHYQQLVQDEHDEQTEHQIEVHLEPIYKELEDIRKRILDISEKEDKDQIRNDKNFDLIIASYRYRLVQLCKQFRQQGYMYEYQYEHLQQFFQLYTQLGGNGAAKKEYDRVMELPLKRNPPAEEQKTK